MRNKGRKGKLKKPSAFRTARPATPTSEKPASTEIVPYDNGAHSETPDQTIRVERELELSEFPAPEHSDADTPAAEPEKKEEPNEGAEQPGTEEGSNGVPLEEDKEDLAELLIQCLHEVMDYKPGWVKTESPPIPQAKYDKLQDRLTRAIGQTFGEVKVNPWISFFTILLVLLLPRVNWKTKKKQGVKLAEKAGAIDIPPENIEQRPEPQSEPQSPTAPQQVPESVHLDDLTDYE